MPTLFMWRTLWLGLCLWGFCATGRAMEKIDYKSLDFTCSREEDHVPKPTPQAEAAYESARQQYQDALAGDEANRPLLTQALKSYAEAAKLGHWRAVRKLATTAASGIDHGMKTIVQPDQSTAKRYAMQLAEMNVGSGYNLLAAMNANSWGFKHDPTLVLQYMRKAADLGNLDAQRQLGKIFLNNFNDLPREQRQPMDAIGRKLLACAVRQGDDEAAFDLGVEYEITAKNFPFAIFYYQQGAKMGHGTCLWVLGKWFRDGKFGYAKDNRREDRYRWYAKQTGIGEGPFLDLDTELPLPPPPNGGDYPPPEMGWPNVWSHPERFADKK